MSSFPCDFSVFPATDFDNFGQQALPNGQLGAVGCILLNEQASALAHMKFCVFGPATIGFSIRADILVRIPEAAGVYLQAAAAGPEASPAIDRAASDWHDLYDLIRRYRTGSAGLVSVFVPVVPGHVYRVNI